MSAATAAPAPASGTVGHRGLITVSIMLATIMQALDTTIANVAMPHMQGSLSAAQDQISWVLTSYIVAAAIMTPVTGWLTGRFGTRQVLLFSIFGFTVASLLCGIAVNLPQMVIYRTFQGICGAALVPLSQAVLLDINPRERHGQAMAMWGAGVMVAPILGPTLGGWLTDNYNWRWVFYINLPIGIMAFLGVFAFVRESVKDRDRPFDWLGFALLSIGLASIQLMLDRGEQKDWFGSLEIIIEATLGGLGLWMFAVHSFTADHPFLDPKLLKDRNFGASLILIFIIGLILYATLALLPPMLQGLMNMPVVTVGFVVMPRGVGTMIAMLFVGRLMAKIDARYILLLGLILTAGSLWMMTGFTLQMDNRLVIWAGLIQGIGLGCLWVPLSALAFATLPVAKRTEAASVFSLIRNIGSSIGIAVVESMLTQNSQISHSSLAAQITPFNTALQAPAAQQAWSIHTGAGLAALNQEITRQAAMISYNDDYKMMMIVALCSMPLLLLLRRPGRPDKPDAAIVMD
ncbi:MAG: EmrB/QacA family drug resistance transporter [Rhodospirillales bacterium]|jgi:DHA2 family multidrug resistance protein|nr:EmrB/QacA family drug resistance transporter [Rhodospirillales bacterium]